MVEQHAAVSENEKKNNQKKTSEREDPGEIV